MKWVKASILLILGSALLIFCLVAGFCGYFYWASISDERIAASRIADHLGIKPDPQTVTDYVYCHLIVLGEPKEKVEANLSKVGPYHSDPNPSFTSYTFDDPYVGPYLGEIQLDYDDNGVLIAKGKRVGLGDYKPFECYSKPSTQLGFRSINR